MKEKNVVCLMKKSHKMFLNKKGGVQFGLKQLIYLTLSLVVLMFLFIIGAKLWSQFSGTDLDEASINNFNNLVEQINIMIDEDKDEIAVPYYLRGSGGQNYGLFGFVGEEGYEREGILTREYIVEFCGAVNAKKEKDFFECRRSEACLCLMNIPSYQGLDTLSKDIEQIKCFSNRSIVGYYVDENAVFSSPYAGKNLEYTPYNSLVIWGTCGLIEKTETKSIYATKAQTKLYPQGNQWDVRTLYIRKLETDGKYIIIFSNVPTENSK